MFQGDLYPSGEFGEGLQPSGHLKEVLGHSETKEKSFSDRLVMDLQKLSGHGHLLEAQGNVHSCLQRQRESGQFVKTQQ